MKELENIELKKMRRRSLIFFLIGVAIMLISIWVNDLAMIRETAIGHVFAEGLTVAAWVSFWEAAAIFLINWMPHRKQIQQYQQIADAEVKFVQGQMDNPDASRKSTI